MIIFGFSCNEETDLNTPRMMVISESTIFKMVKSKF